MKPFASNSMNRPLLYIALIVAFVFVQGLALHGHFQTHSAHGFLPVDHDHFQIHSHGLSESALDVDEHSHAVEIDLLDTPLVRAVISAIPAVALGAVWIVLLSMMWVCVGRLFPPTLFSPVVPPPLLRPSPRAPPF